MSKLLRRLGGPIIVALATVTLCNGCASGSGNVDPWEKTNRFVYDVNEGIDRAALKPLSDLSVKVVPKPVRTGISNGFDNLVYFNVILNDCLQGKWRQGLSDTGRMAVNSTLGIGGILDVATPRNLPAHDNDFGITLAKWGCGPGPYVVLPLLGPRTLRDVPGLGVEYATTPTTWLSLPLSISIALYGTRTIDLRSREDDIARFRNEAAIDPYVFTRNAYLQYREAQIHEGTPASPTSIYDEDTDSSAAMTPTTLPASRSGQ